MILDASVVVNWFVPEEHHRQAKRLRDDAFDGDRRPSAPALLPFEVVNALHYHSDYDVDRLADATESTVYTADSALVSATEETEYAGTVAHLRTYAG